MSQHRSLRGSDITIKHRNVLKRSERVKKMVEKGEKEIKSAFGLPKLKLIKVKISKPAKVAKPKEGEAGAAPVAEAKPVGAVKPGAKASEGKAAAKSEGKAK